MKSDLSGRQSNDGTGMRRRSDVVVRQVGFDAALYDPKTDTVHMLNPVATAVWHHLTPDRSLKNISDALQLTFGTENASSIEKDVASFVRELGRLGLFADGDKPDRPEKARRAREVALPDGEITAYPSRYTSPTVRSFTVDQLQKMYDVEGGKSALFSDLMMIK